MTAIKKGEGEGEGRPQNKAIRAPVGANKFQVALFTKTISSWRSKGWSYLASSITSISLFWTMWENSTSTTRMSTFKLLILSKGKSSISAAKATCPRKTNTLPRYFLFFCGHCLLVFFIGPSLRILTTWCHGIVWRMPSTAPSTSKLKKSTVGESMAARRVKSGRHCTLGCYDFWFFGISIRASRFFRVLSKLRGIAINWGLEAVLKPPARVRYWWKITNKHQKKKLSQKNNKLVFNSSVIETKGFGCFWDSFGGVWGPPDIQLGGEMPYCGNMWLFTPR